MPVLPATIRRSRPPRGATRRLAAVGAPLLLVALGAPPSVAGAQRADSLTAGVRVRVRLVAPERELVSGTLLHADRDSLVVREWLAPARAIGLGVIERLDRLEFTRSSGEGFRRGAKIGAIAGAVVGAGFVAWVAAGDLQGGGEATVALTPFAVVAGAALTAVTTLVGGAIGAASRERWVPVALPR